MTRNVTTLEPESKLLDAVLLVRSSGYRHIPVVKDGRLVGILSDRDIQRASPSMYGDISPDEYNRIFETTHVGRVMAPEPITVTPKSTVPEAVQIMHENKFGALPVVEGDNQLVGIVTTTDLLSLLRTLIEK